jgi:hypothetical protein
MSNIEPPIKINRFSDLLLDNLNTLNWENVKKKRFASGYFIAGVKIKDKDEEKEISNFEGPLLALKNKINLGHRTEELNFNNF